jgi:hypothetical protein
MTRPIPQLDLFRFSGERLAGGVPLELGGLMKPSAEWRRSGL